MARASLLARMFLLWAMACLPLVAQESTSPPTGTDEDWSAIAASAERFAKAFNDGDAAAIAANFVENGEFVDASETIFHGREAIEAEFTAYFEEGPKSTIQIEVDSLRFLTPTLAVEDGVTYATVEGLDHAFRTRYTAVHTKQDDGKWLVASVRDFRDEASEGEGRLAKLAWMVGDWMDEGAESLVETSVYWDESGRYLMREFNVVIEGAVAMQGTQRIAWDPLTKRIQSWVFDSDGGRMQGIWTETESGWIIKSKGVTSEGEVATATHAVVPITEDSFQWMSVDRIVGEQELPDISITIVKRPPGPRSAQTADEEPAAEGEEE